MAPLWLLIIVIYLQSAGGNTLIEEPFSAEASENSEYDRRYNNLYRVLLGNQQFDDDTGTNEYSHVLRNGAENKKHNDRKELEKRKHERKFKVVQADHVKRFNELSNFLRNNMLSTQYFYGEMKRIQRQHEVKDTLRKMVEYAESKPEMKRKILKCYYDMRDLEPRACQLLKCKKPNNLVIHTNEPFL